MAKADKAPLIPVVEAPPPPLLAKIEDITDDKFVHGTFIHRKMQKPFALYKHAPDGYERTHTAKNSVHTWEGTEDEFNLAFEKA